MRVKRRIKIPSSHVPVTQDRALKWQKPSHDKFLLEMREKIFSRIFFFLSPFICVCEFQSHFEVDDLIFAVLLSFFGEEFLEN